MLPPRRGRQRSLCVSEHNPASVGPATDERCLRTTDTTLLREPPRPSAQPDDAAASPSFVLLDDETVDPLSSSTAQAAALRDAETTAYLLFFRLRRSRGMA